MYLPEISVQTGPSEQKDLRTPIGAKVLCFRFDAYLVKRLRGRGRRERTATPEAGSLGVFGVFFWRFA